MRGFTAVRGRWLLGLVVALVAAAAAVAWWRSPEGPRARGVTRLTGAAVHAAAAGNGTCAAAFTGAVTSPSRSGLDRLLVPVLPLPIGPVRATLCRYRPARPVLGVRLDAARTSEAAGWLDTKVTPGGFGQPCPGGSGAVDVLVFGYAHGPDVIVTLHHDGCGTVSNGVLTARSGRALAQSLDGLLPAQG